MKPLGEQTCTPVPASAAVSNLALLFLRISNGAIFISHGWQKLSDMPFFVHGLSQIGINPAGFWGPVAALCEFVGGLCLILGLASRLAALSHAVIMIIAILAVHTPWKYGLTGDRGMEFPLVVLAGSLVVITFGSGKYSLSRVLLQDRAYDQQPRRLAFPHSALKAISWLFAGILLFVGWHQVHVPRLEGSTLQNHDGDDEVIRAEKALWENFQRGDTKSMLAMLHEDFTAFSGSMPGRMETRDAEKDHLLTFFNELKGRLVEYRMINPRVQRFGETAILTYLFSTTVTIQGATETRSGKQTSVWVKTSRGWRQVHYHYDYAP